LECGPWREIGVAYGEAFCQHLGHPHPADDLLARLLNNIAGMEG
jgi:hypothetical protein